MTTAERERDARERRRCAVKPEDRIRHHHALHASCREREERAYDFGFIRGLAVASVWILVVVAVFMAVATAWVTGWMPW